LKVNRFINELTKQHIKGIVYSEKHEIQTYSQINFFKKNAGNARVDGDDNPKSIGKLYIKQFL